MTKPTPVLTPKSAIGDIIAKLEAASGPDRELADEVLRACGWTESTVGYFLGPINYWRAPGRISVPEERRPDPTASLDASLALVEERVPGARVMVERTETGEGWAFVETDVKHMTDGATPALAVLLALFRALDDGASSRPTGQLREAK